MDMALMEVKAMQPSKASLTVIFLRHEIEKGLKGGLCNAAQCYKNI